MKYFTEELLIKSSAGDMTAASEIEKRQKQYIEAFEKVRKRLPKEFVEIYSNNHRFHDAGFPIIRLLTEYPGFTYNEAKYNPTRIEFMLIDCRDINKAWKIRLDNILEVSIKCIMSEKYKAGIEEFNIDEILLYDKKYISWEILLRGSHFKFVFKKLNIEELSVEEIEELRQPVINDKKKK